MSSTSRQFKQTIILFLTTLSLLSLAACEANSYVKVYESETAVMRELDKDLVNIGVRSLVNNLTYPSLTNYTSADFPGCFLDLQNLKAAGSSFSINDAYVVNTNSSSIATDPTNSSFIYFSSDYNFKNASSENTDIKGNLSITLTSSEVIYIKEFIKSEAGFKYAGKLSLMWKDPEITYDSEAAPKAFIASAFKELFNSQIKESIEKELNTELNKYLSSENFDSLIKFNVSQIFSSIPIQEDGLLLKLLGVDTIVLTSKFDTLLTQHYNGYLSGFVNRSDLPAESGFDIKTLELSKLYKAAFIDKFLFESLLNQEAFKGFFIRKSLKQENIPQALNFNFDIRSIAKILPQISNLYSLIQNVEINYAFFNTKFDFDDNKTPKIISSIDFTVFAVGTEKQLNQVFTCQADLAFEITSLLNKTPYLNFNIELIDVGNLKLSNNFSYVDTDYMKFLIKEFINYSLLQNNAKVFEKEINLSDLFEEDFEMKFFKGGVLLYKYLD